VKRQEQEAECLKKRPNRMPGECKRKSSAIARTGNTRAVLGTTVDGLHLVHPPVLQNFSLNLPLHLSKMLLHFRQVDSLGIATFKGLSYIAKQSIRTLNLKHHASSVEQT